MYLVRVFWTSLLYFEPVYVSGLTAAGNAIIDRYDARKP